MKKLILSVYALACMPLIADTFEEHFNQGISLIRQGKREDALQALHTATTINPAHAQTYFNIGIINLDLNDYTQAEIAFKETITRDANYSKAYTFLAETYEKTNRLDDALNYYKKLLEIGGATANTYRSLARICRTQNNSAQAHDYLHRAVQADPNDIQSAFDLAYLYTVQGSYDQAVDYYKKVLTLNPHITDAACNLAQVLRYQGKFAESRHYYENTLAAWPTYAHGLYGYAECCLMLGDYEHGWPAFEARWKREKDSRHFSEKLWDGSDLKNKTIILRAEYGQGDTLQFIRYAPLLKAQGATVLLEAQHTLLTLLSYCPYIDRIIPVDDNGHNLPPHDYQVPIMSLPYHFKTTLETVPNTFPYISIPKQLTTEWKEKLSQKTTFKIGICWEGSPYYEQFKSAYSKKSIPLASFAPLAQTTGVTLYSLQKMNGTEQLRSLPEGMHVHEFGDSFDHDHGRFMDTAAVIQNLDLVITTDTSVAHLAGALGKPVWVLLPIVADWRWMLNRIDSPWYPSMRLFRQTSPGDWNSVMHQVCQEVATLLVQKNSPSVRTPISVMTEVQIGELIDKITILQIKMERIKDPAKLKNIKAELTTLMMTYELEVPKSPKLQELWDSLKQVNGTLWVIEDDIRDKERDQQFDDAFIKLARDVYYTNDERCRIKREINLLAGSRLIEEKSYKNYKTT